MRATALYVSGLFSGAIVAACVPAIAERKAQTPVPLGDVQTIVEIWNRIKAEYVDPVDDNVLRNGCISGMVALDPQSAYLNEKAFRALSMSPQDVAGVGLELANRAGQVVVIAPIDKAPAARAGVRPGDVLTAVDSQTVLGLKLSDVIDRLRGEAASQVTLTFARHGESNVRRISLTRERIEVPSATARVLPGGAVYLRVSSFTAQSGPTVKSALDAAVGKNKPSGLVLDLRNNPGGLVNGVIDVANLLVGLGTIVVIEGRTEAARRTFEARGTGPYVGMRTIVLVNEGTAAGSEILAESLRQNAGAKLLGKRTFGRGSIQTILPLVDNTALKITTGRWKTAAGHTLEGHGLIPDIELPDTEPLSRPPESDPWVLRAAKELAAQPGAPADGPALRAGVPSLTSFARRG